MKKVNHLSVPNELNWRAYARIQGETARMLNIILEPQEHTFKYVEAFTRTPLFYTQFRTRRLTLSHSDEKLQ
jgi:hypothetical protein